MSRINRLSASPLVSAVMAGLMVVATIYVFAHQAAFWWVPSLFEDDLADKSYAYWGRWVQPSKWYSFDFAFAIYIVWYLISQTVDGVYGFVRRHPWVPLLLPLIFLGLLVGRDVYAGFAIYGDRIAMRSPLSPAIKAYRVSDVARVEVGCKNSKRHDIWKPDPLRPVPLYTVVFRDGTILTPFSLTDNRSDPRLMAAVLQFDRSVQAAGVTRIYWQVDRSDPNLNQGRCFDALERYYQPSLRPGIRQTFMSTGVGL